MGAKRILNGVISIHLCCLLLSVMTSNGAPTVLTIQQLHPEAEVHLGDSLLLLCKYDANQAVTGEQVLPPSGDQSGSHQQCDMTWTKSHSGSDSVNHTASGIPAGATIMRLMGDASGQNTDADGWGQSVLSLYVEKVDERHTGRYMCELVCPQGMTISKDVDILVRKPDTTTSTAETVPNVEPENKESESEEDINELIMSEFRMALAMAMGLLLVALFGLLICVKSRVKSAKLKKEQKPPSYADVLQNPEKYPMSGSSESRAESTTTDDVEESRSETGTQNNQEEHSENPPRQQPQSTQHQNSQPQDIFTVEIHSS